MSKNPKLLTSQVHSQLIGLCRSAVMSGLNYEEMQTKIARHFVKLKISDKYEKRKEEERPHLIKKRLPALVRVGSFLLPLFLLGGGVYLVSLAVMPILGYYIDDSKNSSQQTLTAPIPRQYVMDLTPLVIANNINDSDKDGNEGFKPPTVIDSSIDYTNLANWFTGSLREMNLQLNQAKTAMTEYKINIPAIKVEEAVVKIGGSDLNQSLIAYPGTALPGEFGAPVIFGHSILRKFYNPSGKNPRRYASIFSYIMTLKPGEDKIFITADGVTYTYLVQDKTEVKPEDVYILTQQYDAKRIKLVTCVPEGTYLKRGVVTAQLIEENKE